MVADVRPPFRVIRACVAALCAALCCGAGAASAAVRLPAPVGVAVGEGRVVSDRSSYYAFSQAPGLLKVVNTLTGKSRAVPVGAGCDAKAAVGERVLLQCSRPVSRDVFRVSLLNLRTAERVDVPGLLVGGDQRFRAFGSQWVAGEYCLGSCSILFINWRTGERRGGPPGQPARDLDSPDLTVAAPAPPASLFRKPFVYGTGKARVVLSRCLKLCSSIQRAPNFYSWVEVNRVYAFRAGMRRPVVWNLPRISLPNNGIVVDAVHTRNRLIANILISDASPRYRVYSLRVP